MKYLIAPLIMASTCLVRAANPAFTAFKGTNQVLINSNVTTGNIIIGPATPISTTASNAAKSLMVWTNDTSVSPFNFVYPLQIDVPVDMGDFPDFGSNASTNYSLFVHGRHLDNRLGVRSLHGSLSIIGNAENSDSPIAVGLLGNSSFGSKTNIGTYGFGLASENNTVGIGTVGSAFVDGVSGSSVVGGYFELGGTLASDPFVPTNAVIIVDSRETGADLITGRTNNGTMTFQVSSVGSATMYGGSYYPSNAITVGAISAGMTNGAFWVGTLSNALQAVWMSNNVTLFKKLAP